MSFTKVLLFVALLVSTFNLNAAESITGETPSKVDATHFNLSRVPAPATLKFYFNGVRLKKDLDYTLSGVTVVLNTAAQAEDVVQADYLALVPSGWRQLINKTTGLCITRAEGSLKETACAAMNDEQLVSFAPVDGGYKITFKSTGNQMDVIYGQNEGGQVDGILLCDYPFWGGANETFYLLMDSEQNLSITIKSTNYNSCVSNVSGSPVQFHCTGSNDDKWIVK